MKFLKALTLSVLSVVAFSATTFNSTKKINAEDDKTMSDCYSHGIKTVGDFSINTYLDSTDLLEIYKLDGITPANTIITIDKDLNILDKDGNSIGVDINSAKEFYFNDDIIPCIYLKDNEIEEAFASFWKSDWNKWDMSVVASDSDLLLKARKDLPIVRGILDVSSRNLTTADYGALVGEAHTARANTIIVNKSIANRETFDYFQARFKTVWVDDRDASDIELVNHVTQGVYGVLVNDIETAIDTLKILNSTVYSSLNYTRTPFNIAHRGLCTTNYENSLEGCIEAYENGATHFEIDFQVTKDNKLAIMHDETIDRTTNGTGRVCDYTAEELKSFKIIKSYSGITLGEGVAIPMLDDLFNYFKGKDIVIIVEIKTSNINAVPLLKEYIEAADNASQIVVISFYQTQLARMRDQIPYIPCADLNDMSGGTFAASELKNLNTGNYIPDLNYSSVNSSHSTIRNMAYRGYASYQWTFSDYAYSLTGLKAGIVGLTNNTADVVGKSLPKTLEIPENITTSSLEGFSTEAYATNFLGERFEKKLTATPLIVKDNGDTAEVIFQAKFNSGNTTPKLVTTLFSDVVTVTIGAAQSSSSTETTSSSQTSSSGCSGEIAGGAMIALFALASILILIRRRENK